MADICCTADELISELREENESLAKSVIEAAESLNTKDKRIAELSKENKELKMEIQNLHQFIKKHIRGDIYE